jgi:hypothetical protein
VPAMENQTSAPMNMAGCSAMICTVDCRYSSRGGRLALAMMPSWNSMLFLIDF